jgi:hypothetical protein
VKLFSKKALRSTVAKALLFAVIFLPGLVSAASFSQNLTFQGKLSDTGSVANGAYNIKFEICSDASCSSVVWTEFHDESNAGKVSVTNGIFNVILGSDVTLVGVDMDQTLYLRISVDGTGSTPSYATPLGIIPMGMVPAAREADYLDGIDSTQFATLDEEGENMFWSSSATPTASVWPDRSIVAFGDNAGEANPASPFLNASNNTSIGSNAGTGAGNASNNVFVGTNAGTSVFTGAGSVFVGSNAAYNSVSASQSVYVGAEAGYSAGGALANIFIGYRSGYNEAGSNKLYIENSNSASPLIYGEFDNDILRINGELQTTGGITIGVTSTDYLIDDSSNGSSSGTIYIGNETIDTSVSDRRLKQNIASSNVSALEYLGQFSVVSFDWLEENERAQDGRVPFGLVAQDVNAIAPQYARRGAGVDDYMSVRFQDMVPITIKAVQELDARVAAIEGRGVAPDGQPIVVTVNEIPGATIFDGLVEVFEGMFSFGRGIKAPKVVTDELCFDDICVTREEAVKLIELVRDTE